MITQSSLFVQFRYFMSDGEVQQYQSGGLKFTMYVW